MSATIIADAEQVCVRLGARFTPPRRRILQLLADSKTPLKAYDLIAKAGEDGGAVKPPTVYRALEFLVAAGLVHRIEQDSSFMACQHVHGDHDTPAHLAGLFVCQSCGAASEVHVDQAGHDIKMAANSIGFHLDRLVVEGRGTCRACAAA